MLRIAMLCSLLITATGFAAAVEVVQDNSKPRKAEIRVQVQGDEGQSGETVAYAWVLGDDDQNADGSITVPEVLKPYMGGMEKIGG